MPVRVGSPSTPIKPEANRSFEYAYVAWVDPTGREWSLSDVRAGYVLTQGVQGLGSIPITVTADAHPRGGSRIRSTRYEARILTLPIFVWGADHEGFLQPWRDLEDAFTRTSEEGLGYLRVVRPDGTERRIDASYYAGWENGQGDDWSFDVVPVQLYCPRGFWYSPTPVLTERGATTGASFFAPYPRVSSGRVLGATTLTNPGQLTAYPSWTVAGPMTALEADVTHADGSTETFTVTHTLTAGQNIFITTDPPTIKDDAGDSLLGALTMPGSALWGIGRGTSEVTFTVTGSGSQTKITLSFLPRFKQA
jgi:hypothetical protein